MSTARFETFLARIYVDAEARTRFLADPRGEAMRAGLAEQEVTALEKIDRVGLELAAQSLQHKRRRFRWLSFAKTSSAFSFNNLG
jgi:hypothetical protein